MANGGHVYADVHSFPGLRLMVAGSSGQAVCHLAGGTRQDLHGCCSAEQGEMPAGGC